MTTRTAPPTPPTLRQWVNRLGRSLQDLVVIFRSRVAALRSGTGSCWPVVPAHPRSRLKRASGRVCTSPSPTATGAGGEQARDKAGALMAARRFPPPWSAEQTEACYMIRDANGRALAYVYYEQELGDVHRPSCSPATRRGASP